MSDRKKRDFRVDGLLLVAITSGALLVASLIDYAANMITKRNNQKTSSWDIDFLEVMGLALRSKNMMGKIYNLNGGIGEN